MTPALKDPILSTPIGYFMRWQRFATAFNEGLRKTDMGSWKTDLLRALTALGTVNKVLFNGPASDEPALAQLQQDQRLRFQRSDRSDLTTAEQLLLVGPAKAISVVSLLATEYQGIDLDFVRSQARANGLTMAVRQPDQGSVFPGGHVCVYFRAGVQALIDRRFEIISAVGWPTDANGFVRQLLAREEPDPLLEVVLAEMFCDETLCAGTAQHAMLMAERNAFRAAELPPTDLGPAFSY